MWYTLGYRKGDIPVQACKLAKAQVRDLMDRLAKEPLENYELLWVLESCLETPASSVHALGVQLGSAGIIVIHRDCVWLRLDNEMHLSALLEPLPEQDYYRFYTSNASTLDMLQRWFPQGQLSQSRLCVRNLTKTWRKRFAVEIQVEADPETPGAQIYVAWDAEGGLVAQCRVEEVVQPWHEVVQWQVTREQDVNYWTEQVFGAATAALLAKGSPVVVRVAEDELYSSLETLDYREFKQLYYYVAVKE